MSWKCANDSTRQLILSVDVPTEGVKAWHGRVVFTTHPECTDEAKQRMAAIVPWLWYTIGKECLFETPQAYWDFLERNVNHHFSVYSIKKALRTKWDPILGVAESLVLPSTEAICDVDEDMERLAVDLTPARDSSAPVSTTLREDENSVSNQFNLRSDLQSGTLQGIAKNVEGLDDESITVAGTTATGRTENTASSMRTAASTKKRMNAANGNLTDALALLDEIKTKDDLAKLDLDTLRAEFSAAQAATAAPTEARSGGKKT